VVAELARLRDVGPDAIAGAARRAYDLLVAPPAVARKES
jgi:hypothetical protein